MKLKEYQRKRRLQLSGEPSPKNVQDVGKVFVIHKHAASHLHFDLRLSDGKVLLSWAVPKGIPLKRGDKHFAKHVEDHPLEYRNFEGNIPEGNYGAGSVMIYDYGEYEGDLAKGLKKGHISISLKGMKIAGRFSLVKLKDDDWIFISHTDSAEIRDLLQERSVASHKLMAEIFLEKRLKLDAIPDTPISETKDLRVMRAKTANKPFSSKNHLYEIKLDGYRAIAEINLGEVKLISRNNLNFKEKFKIIYDELRKFKYSAVFDGEIVALDENGNPRFEFLQNVSPQDSNLFYYVFDIIYFENHDLRSLPLQKRKEFLSQVIPPGSRVRYLGHVEEKGEEYFKVAMNKQFEGLIAKKKNSKYKSGLRTEDWLKIKNLPIEDFVIVGYTNPEGSRKYFGSLALARIEKGKLEYFGNVGTGFSDLTLKDIYNRLNKIKTEIPLFKDVKNINWVKPELIARIKFLERTSIGQLRHPSFVGLKEDETPKIILQKKTDEKILEIDNHTIRISNPEKVYFPEMNIRKIDLINYYLKIAEYILPFLIDRPQSLHRFPDGIYGEKFYHKDTSFKEKWLKTYRVTTKNKKTNYVLINDKASLAYVINLGCIELNPWLSKINKIKNPDILVFDIDPGEKTSFELVRNTAFEIKKIFDKLKVKLFVKTSGSTGLHIFIHLDSKGTFENSKLFAELVSTYLQNKFDYISLVRDPALRKNKVYIDFLQNNLGQTIASVFSIRPNKEALISAPISWSKLKTVLPKDYNFQTIFQKLGKNPWQDFFLTSYNLNDLYDRFKKLIQLERS